VPRNRVFYKYAEEHKEKKSGNNVDPASGIKR